MIAIGIRYLCGWAMATHPTDRRRAEWPPHPDRVFLALVAAHFETDGGPEEADVLRRLSALPAPELSASAHHERLAVTAFVPVNGDTASDVSKEGGPLLPHSWPIRRSRQARTFPVAIPDRDIVYLIWRDAELPAPALWALGELCRKVAAVGHSASLVQMWVEDNPPPLSDHVPTDRLGTPLRLRVPHPGRLDQLPDPSKTDLRPPLAGWRGYGPPVRSERLRDVPTSVFAPDLIVLRRTSGRPLGLESTLLLSEALRQAVIEHCPEPVPEWVSGHDGPGGPPSQKPHVAVLVLADVGHPHAEGRLLGLALAIPREGISPDEQRRSLAPLLIDQHGRPKPVHLRKKADPGGFIDWELALDDREDRPFTLRPETWTAPPSATWATVTPIVLDRYPKSPGDAEATIRRACRNVGLPEPVQVLTTPAPLFAGVPHARRFPPHLNGPKSGKRFHTHAFLRFPGPVRGPVLLGAGRYRGYGLCRPRREES